MAGLILMGLLLSTSIGCFTTTTAKLEETGESRFVRGELRAVLPYPSGEVDAAIGQSVERLDMGRVSRHADNLSGKYKLKTGDDRTVNVRYERLDSDSTLIRILVGTFGDRELSSAFLLEVKNILGRERY